MEDNERCKKKARRIPEIPERLIIEMLSDISGDYLTDGTVPIGIDYDSMKIVSYSLLKNNEISVFGDEVEKKENICSRIISVLKGMYNPEKIKIFLINDAERNFRALAETV